MQKEQLIAVKKAVFPFNAILWLFFIENHKGAYHEVAMVNPFTSNIITIGDNLISMEMYKHEKCHVEQIQREGRFKFICKYLYYNIRYGYRNNLYEVEAREVASK